MTITKSKCIFNDAAIIGFAAVFDLGAVSYFLFFFFEKAKSIQRVGQQFAVNPLSPVIITGDDPPPV